jgi:hypothetical protein
VIYDCNWIEAAADIRTVLPVPDKLCQSELEFSNYDPGLGRGKFHECIEVHGGTDRVRSAAGGGRDASCRGLPEGRDRDATFYNWRKKYAGLMPSAMKRRRQLEEENAKLKQIVAAPSLDKAMLQDVLSKKL